MAFFVGLDPASRRAGLAAINHESQATGLELHATGELPTRLHQLRQETRDWLAALAEHGVHAVVIEKPAARHGGPALLASYGVLLEAARAALPDTLIMDLRSQQVDQHVHGRALPAGERKQTNVALAREHGYFGGSQDVCDAIACALAARALIDAHDKQAAA